MPGVSFGSIFSLFCCGACLVSCLFNGLLIYIVQQRRAGIGFYRFFTLATVIIGLLYSVAFAAAQPLWYAGPGMLGFFSISPWNSDIKLIRVAFQFWFTSFVLVLICMTCSFTYRYGLLCSPRIVAWFELPRRSVIIFSFLLSFCVWWLYISNYFLFHESRKVRKLMHYKFSAEYTVDLLSSYVLTVDINDQFAAKRSITGAALLIVVMTIQILIMFNCGFRIHTTVKRRTMSDRMKQIHRNALRMMILQALNPVLFLYLPAFVNLFGMFFEADFGYLPNILAMSLALFPIFNPLIVICFTQEYKRFIFPRRSSTIQITSSAIMSAKVVHSEL